MISVAFTFITSSGSYLWYYIIYNSVESWNYTNLRLVNDIKSLDKKHETVLKIIDPVIKTCNEDLKQFNIERSQLCRDLRAKIFSLKVSKAKPSYTNKV